MEKMHKSNRQMTSLVVLAAAVAGVAGLANQASAAPKYWDTTSAAGLLAGNGTWGTDSYWATTTGGTTLTSWANGDDAFFQAASNPTYIVALSGTIQANSLTFASSNNVTFNSGTLQIGAGGLSNTSGSAGPVLINSAVSLNGSQTWNGQYNVGITTVAGDISESVVGSSLTMTSTGGTPSGGVLALSGNNSYTGGTFLNGTTAAPAKIKVSSNTALGTGTLTLGGGQLVTGAAVTLANNIVVGAGAAVSTVGSIDFALGNLTLNGNITGSGALYTKNIANTNTLALFGDNSGFNGAFTNQPGSSTLRFASATAGSGSAAWALGTSKGLLDFGGTTGGSVSLGSLAATGGSFTTTIGSGDYTLVIGALGTNTSYGGTVTQGTGSATSLGVTKTGGGIQTLSAANTYKGVTTIMGGALSISTLANINSASGIGLGVSTNDATNAASLVLDGGTLQYTGAAVNTNRLFTLGANGGTLDASGTGAVNFNKASASIAFSGSGPRTLTLTGTNTSANTLLPIVGNNGSDVTSLAKSGAGQWVLSGANTYTGPTTITGGTLAMASAGTINNSSGVSLANSATFDVSAKPAGYSVPALSGVGTAAVLAGQKLTVTGALNADAQTDTLSITGGGLKLGSTSKFEIDLTGGIFDATSVAQALDYSSTSLNIVFNGTTAVPQSYQILSFASYAGTPTVSYSGLSGSETASFDATTGIVTVSIPEPTTLGALLGAGGIGLLARRRGRRA